MNIHNQIAMISILCLLGGCAAPVNGHPTAAEPGASQLKGSATGGVAGAPANAEPSTAKTNAAASEADQIIEGNVSSVFPGRDASQCKPLGMPLTAFLTNTFGENALVDETATLDSDAACVHEQTLAAPTNAWAAFAYGVICQGGGEVRFCGAVTKRRCSVDLLMQWAAERNAPVSTQNLGFGLDLEVPSQDGAARAALYRRAQQEVRTLLDESAAVMGERAAGTRDCPDEDSQDVAAVHSEASNLDRQLVEILSNTTSLVAQGAVPQGM